MSENALATKKAPPGGAHPFDGFDLIAMDVGAARHHLARAATVCCLIAKANKLYAVNENVGTARIGVKGVRPAARGVNAGVAHANCRKAIDKDV